jgi:hypothetical protein
MKVSYSFIENSPKRQSLSLKQDWFFTTAVLNIQVQHFFFFLVVFKIFEKKQNLTTFSGDSPEKAPSGLLF